MQLITEKHWFLCSYVCLSFDWLWPPIVVPLQTTWPTLRPCSYSPLPHVRPVQIYNVGPPQIINSLDHLQNQWLCITHCNWLSAKSTKPCWSCALLGQLATRPTLLLFSRLPPIQIGIQIRAQSRAWIQVESSNYFLFCQILFTVFTVSLNLFISVPCLNFDN